MERTGKEWLALWEVKQLWHKTTDEICDYILNCQLCAYSRDKKFINDLNEYTYETKKYASELTGATNTRKIRVRTGRKVSLDTLVKVLGYFKFDDIMNFALDNELPIPNSDTTTTLDKPVADNQKDRRRKIILETYEEANRIYKAMKTPKLSGKTALLKQRIEGVCKKNNFKYITESMIIADMYDVKKIDAKYLAINFFGKILLAVLKNNGFDDKSYQKVYGELKRYHDDDPQGRGQVVTAR